MEAGNDSENVEMEEKKDALVKIGQYGAIISPKRVFKNLVVISLAWVLQFTAFQAMANLQSSLNMEGNVGVISLAILYGFLVVSSALLPNAMITVLGLKWTISVCQVTYLLYILANIHPIGGLLYPAAILVGLGAAPLWTSQSTYITQIGNIYAEQKHTDPDTKVARFFGFFFMCFQTSQIWGNLISYFVLSPEVPLNRSTVNYSLCGGEYNPATVSLTEGQADVPQRTRNILIGVYVGAILLSMIVVLVLLDQRKKPTTGSRSGSRCWRSSHTSLETLKETLIGSVKLLKSAFIHAGNIDQILLIFMTVWNGLEQSFFGAQFTQGLVTCGYGIQNIGLVFICYGVCNAVSSFCSGHLVTYVNRRFLIYGAAVLSFIVMGVISLWTPGPNNLYVCFLLGAMWGIADAVYLTQMYAFYGLVFKNNLEPAYSNYRLWESIGFVIAYAYTPFIKVKNSCIVLFVVLLAGLIGFTLVDVRYNFPTIWKKITRLDPPDSVVEDTKEK